MKVIIELQRCHRMWKTNKADEANTQSISKTWLNSLNSVIDPKKASIEKIICVPA